MTSWLLALLVLSQGNVMYTSGVMEYERFVSSLNQKGLKKPLFLGYSAISTARGSGVELFVGVDSPLRKGDILCPYFPPVDAWGTVVSVTKGAGVVVYIHSSRESRYARSLVRKYGKRIQIKEVKTRAEAMQAIFRLYRKPPRMLILGYDIEILDPWVLREALRLQFERNVLVVGRSRHEALAGAGLAVEPVYDPAAVVMVSGSGNPQNGCSPAKINLFFNPYAIHKLGIGRKVMETLGARALGR